MSSKRLVEFSKRFPLRRIKTDKELRMASKIFTELGMKDKLSPAENDYFEVLELLIVDYEAKSPKIQAMIASARNIPPQEVLRSLINENRFSQSQLAREVGCHQEHISAFLAGKRGLSKINAMKLANYFKVSVELFLPKISEAVTIVDYNLIASRAGM
jgi:antitoxin component HigA of HigAB toxin-antitoxin module